MEWMVFIMPVLEKIKQVFLLLLILLTIPQAVSAETFNTEIIAASLEPENQSYKLNADIKFKLSPVAIEAIEHSVAFSWIIQLKLFRQRPYFWDEEILDHQIQYKLRYHALLNMYQVENVISGEIRRFFSLPVALNAMGRIRDVNVVPKHGLIQSEKLLATLKVEFDREALPLPLRPVAYFDSQWDLSSQILKWSLKR